MAEFEKRPRKMKRIIFSIQVEGDRSHMRMHDDVRLNSAVLFHCQQMIRGLIQTRTIPYSILFHAT
jgi:hypothetical protein